MNRVVVNDSNNVVILEFDGVGSDFSFELTPVSARLLAEKLINAAAKADTNIRLHKLKDLYEKCSK